jgi:hypothetical protein
MLRVQNSWIILISSQNKSKVISHAIVMYPRSSLQCRPSAGQSYNVNLNSNELVKNFQLVRPFLKFRNCHCLIVWVLWRQFLFTAYSKPLAYSRTSHFVSACCCTVTVSETLTNRCIWTQLTDWGERNWTSRSMFRACAVTEIIYKTVLFRYIC